MQFFKMEENPNMSDFFPHKVFESSLAVCTC